MSDIQTSAISYRQHFVFCLLLFAIVFTVTAESYGCEPDSASSKGRITPSELVDRYLHGQDRRSLFLFGMWCRASNNEKALRELPKLANCINAKATERESCDVYTLLLDCPQIPQPVIRAIQSRFNPRKPQLCSTTYEAALLLKVNGKHAAALKFLRKQLASKQTPDRALAASVLGHCGATWNSAPELQKALKDPSSAVRTHAALSHWQLHRRKEAVVPVLLKVLATEDHDFVPLTPVTMSEWRPGQRYLAALWFIGNAPDNAAAKTIMKGLATGGDCPLQQLDAEFTRVKAMP